ncbi:MAG: prolyl oligopeptidase family serine peptidase [Gemmatimonadaceae bacterium]|nr:prolyl oligopeptidase family serine peptidase [Gemmatimonadaceae bacterium]
MPAPCSRAVRTLAVLPLLAARMALPAQPAAPVYPTTATVPHVDDYHGTPVPDPYRWLEDDTASAVKAWVGSQNAVTSAWLGAIPWRGQLAQRIRALQNYPRTGAPIRRAGWYLWTRNSGLQDQSVWYIRRGERGAARVLIDPNVLDPAGTTRYGGFRVDRRGTHVGYTISRAGSDWQEIRVLDPVTGRDRADRVRWVKVSGIAWWKDGFFYSRYPAPADTTKALSVRNEDHRVFYHRVGTPQSADVPVFADPAHPQRFHTVSTTEDERWAVLTISDRGRGKDGNELWVRDLAGGDTTWRPLVRGFDHITSVLDTDGDDALLLLTNRGAPNRRVVRVRVADPDPARWEDVIPEAKEKLDDVSIAGAWLFAHYLRDVATVIEQVDRTGRRVRTLALPDVGTASLGDAERTARDAFLVFTSFTRPATTWRVTLASGRLAAYDTPALPFDASRYTTTRAWATSKDGTKVPMFIVHRSDVKRDGTNPTIVYGYGGFNVSTLPSFSAARIAWLEQGGIYVSVNMRGGGEYGEAWHEAGMRERKQNVFDDFIAAAEQLVADRWTSSSRLAMQGGSNGGLLVGAVMTQRPELFKVALPAVGVMDMLRFQKFTIGWNWVADYGSSDDPAGFAYLRAYSPLQNLRDGVSYPATLVTTADHDDRVVPAHSFKFAARLQAAHRGPNPVLIRIDTQSGHGASSLGKGIELAADQYAFTMWNLGMTPRFTPVP